MNTCPSKAPRPRGRPRQFDREAALETAMRLFWQRGYEATSISELSSAMGIQPPSLYHAFGDKRSLFREALNLYVAGPGRYVAQALEADSARDAIDRLLTGAVKAQTRPDCPTGCLATFGTLNGGGAECDDLAEEVTALREALRRQVQGRIARGVQDGELPASTDTQAMADAVLIFMSGLAIHARGGRTRESLMKAAHLLIAGLLPEPRRRS